MTNAFIFIMAEIQDTTLNRKETKKEERSIKSKV